MNFIKKNVNFHQTEIMYQLVNKKINIKKPKFFHLYPSQLNFKKNFSKKNFNSFI